VADKQARRINTLSTWLIIAGAVLLGFLLLAAATQLPDGWFQTVVEQAGGAVLVTALLTVAYDLVGRRALAAEVMEMAELSGDVEQAGLERIGANYQAVPFDRLLKADKIDIYLGLGRTWYSVNSTALQAAAAKPTTRMRVILADPTDDAAVECMALRFSRSTEQVRSDIRSATDSFLALARAASGTITVYHRGGEPLNALYRFDREAVITLYSHRRSHGDVPYMLCRSGGSLYDFVRNEFTKLIEQSRELTTGTGADTGGSSPQLPTPPTSEGENKA
jgi:hypothetical protein